MEIKKVWSVWFSGTGTTQKVATALSKQGAEGLQAQWEDYSFNLPAAALDPGPHPRRRGAGGAGGAVWQPEL